MKEQQIPEYIKKEIVKWTKSLFPFITLEDCLHDPYEHGRLNEIHVRVRNNLQKGAEFGYSLAQNNLAEKEQEIVELKKAIRKLLPLAIDGRKLHISNAVHNEFIEEDNEDIRFAQNQI